MKTTTVILAAGQGTRMLSSTPKVLHKLNGQPLIWYPLQVAARTSSERPVVVVGHEADAVRKFVGDKADFAVQEQQLGTGHAVQAAESLLAGKTDRIIVINADLPLLLPESIERLVSACEANNAPVSILTVRMDDSKGFGRVIRNDDGTVRAIVEEAQASEEQLKVKEFNVGAYCFSVDWLFPALRRVKLSPKGEYYLTDVIEIAVQDGLPVQAVPCTHPDEAMGINNRVHLAQSEAALRRRINESWMLAGVTMTDPDSTYIGPEVTIARDTIIEPNTCLRGKTVIGENCIIGPNSIIEDCQVGNRCKVVASMLEKAVLEDQVDIGPFGHLRKGAHLASGVHMGNFGEVKDSYLGPGTKMGHFSYIGNANIGSDVNIGAGTITCNFDGVNKHPTEIGDHVFIGSDTMLVAPIVIGEGARTGAGSVVIHNVTENSVVVGVPARLLRKLDEGE